MNPSTSAPNEPSVDKAIVDDDFDSDSDVDLENMGYIMEEDSIGGIQNDEGTVVNDLLYIAEVVQDGVEVENNSELMQSDANEEVVKNANEEVFEKAYGVMEEMINGAPCDAVSTGDYEDASHRIGSASLDNHSDEDSESDVSLAAVDMELDSEDEDSGNAVLKTKHEVEEMRESIQFPLEVLQELELILKKQPESQVLPASAPIPVAIGTVTGIMNDGLVLIQSQVTETPLMEGAILIVQTIAEPDQSGQWKVLGLVQEVLGSITQPFYSVYLQNSNNAISSSDAANDNSRKHRGKNNKKKKKAMKKTVELKLPVNSESTVKEVDSTPNEVPTVDVETDTAAINDATESTPAVAEPQETSLMDTLTQSLIVSTVQEIYKSMQVYSLTSQSHAQSQNNDISVLSPYMHTIRPAELLHAQRTNPLYKPTDASNAYDEELPVSVFFMFE